ncbi:hypothetical protein GHT07_19330 [Caenimonas koreensis DSM 17982]|uniref:Uncharacterized protein n=1 Tax=Caenimonas koreensis DSM 17982 TaxID=1121255 RepID=A0A844AY06_9BURK|nr:hypothetical protein [Caenimonas koreensis]MRD49430.1 hypothetical protein [Caenimonas koreensis DSM 17982]
MQQEQTRGQDPRLAGIESNILAASDPHRDLDSAMRELLEGFHKASDFTDVGNPDFHDMVVAFTSEAVRLIERQPMQERSDALQSLKEYLPYFDNDRPRPLPTPISMSMLEPQLLKKLIDSLLRGSEVSVDLAINLVGKLARNNREAGELPLLLDSVLTAARLHVIDDDLVQDCVQLGRVLQGMNDFAPAATAIAHICLDHLEYHLASIQQDNFRFSSHGKWVLERLEDNHLQPNVGIAERLGRLLVDMTPASLNYDFSRRMGRHNWPVDFWCDVIRAGLGAAAISQMDKQEVALAALAGAQQSGFRLSVSVHMLCSASSRYLPDELKPVLIEKLLSKDVIYSEVANDLARTIDALPEGSERDRLRDMLRQKLVKECSKTDQDLLSLVRVALSVDHVSEGLMASALLRSANSYIYDASRQNSAKNLDRMDDYAILTFTFDPDGSLFVPDSQERDVGNKTNPDFLINGEHFTYPKWLADRRQILQQAQPAIAAGRVASMVEVADIPKELAQLTAAYTGRLVTPDDWPAMKQVLTAARIYDPQR